MLFLTATSTIIQENVSKVSLKAFTLNNQWSFGVDPKYPLVDLTNIYTHNIKIFLPSEIVENLWVEAEIIFL